MRRRSAIAAAAIAIALAAAGCKREERGFRVQPPSADRTSSISQSDLHPGGSAVPPVTANEYEENAQAVADGQMLFEQFNCVGCHAHGGGGMGPALRDRKWIYGSDPANIFATIVEGRPNGMPSFRGKIPDYQVWQLVAYVRSLSGLVPKDVVPSRADELQPAPGSREQQPAKPPVETTVPKTTEPPR
jgi:cytochrome c oxidase cbb3-type subunit 3